MYLDQTGEFVRCMFAESDFLADCQSCEPLKRFQIKIFQISDFIISQYLQNLNNITH